MEICTSRALSNLPWHGRIFTPYHTRLPWIQRASNLGFNPGGLHYTNSSVRLFKSEEASSYTSRYVKAESDDFITTEDSKSVDQINSIEAVQSRSSEQDDDYDSTAKNEDAEVNPLSEIRAQLSNLFEELDIEFDPENLSSLIALGGGAAVALWLTSAVVGAIDAIPLFPKLMEVVGLGYTLWFSTRYLLFKRNRDELALKVEELKKNVLGSDRD
ncbi:unnamed protein product [Cuscuta campestris]|uniref:Cyanobacterial aminoacyl-tRNA synthetase CAAD domain-containing protein n=1 Tax=Cuscuta campestris TaxID=132261 RepID=A0A484MYM7_9ASTE|nr:unnamed protein product [Cuscuta campestris]